MPAWVAKLIQFDGVVMLPGLEGRKFFSGGPSSQANQKVPIGTDPVLVSVMV